MLLAEEVLALDPFNVKANTLVADAGVTLGYPAFRSFAFETLAEGRPNDKAVLNTLAKTYMDLHEAVKAEKTYQRILDIDPRDGRRHQRLEERQRRPRLPLRRLGQGGRRLPQRAQEQEGGPRRWSKAPRW